MQEDKIKSYYYRRKSYIDKVLYKLCTKDELDTILYEILYNKSPVNKINLENKNLDDIIEIVDILNITPRNIDVCCANCGKLFNVSLGRYKKYKNLYCCPKCKEKYYKIIHKNSKEISLDFIKQICNKINFTYVGFEGDYIRLSESKVFYICNKHKNEGVQSCRYDTLHKMVKRNKCSCHLKAYNKDDLNIDIGDNIDVVGEYVNDFTPIMFRCNICGYKWINTPNKIKHGRKCPNCRNREKGTKGEREVAKYLDEMGIEYITQCTMDKCVIANYLRFDFYLPEYNTCIEYMGEQYYYPVCFSGISEEKALENFNVSKERDEFKRKYCKERNIKLIEIPYWDFKNIRNILSELFY